MEEKVFMNEKGVLVSSSRVEIGGQTFATRNIGSVKVTEPGVSKLAILLMIIGAGALAGKTTEFGWFCLVTGAIWAYLTAIQRELKLVAGGGEVLALKTSNKSHAEQVRAAIADAISVR